MDIPDFARRYRIEALQARARNRRGIEIGLCAGLLSAGVLAIAFSAWAGFLAVQGLAILTGVLAVVLLARVRRNKRLVGKRIGEIAVLAALTAFLLAWPGLAAVILAGLIVTVLMLDGGMKLYGALPDRDHPRRVEFLLTGSGTLGLGLVFWFTLGRHAPSVIGIVLGLAALAEGFRILRAIRDTRGG